MREQTGTGWPEEPRRDAVPEVDVGLSTPESGDQIEAGRPTSQDGAGDGERRARRFSAAGAVIGLLLGLFGFALVVQIKSNVTDPQLAAARPEDLVRILSDLEAREERLRGEITDLQDSQRQLASGAQGRAAALEEARRRADELGILAGTLPAEGSGLTVQFRPGSGKPVRALALLDAVEELRGAGAEAMQIAGSDGTAVRIVASTAFVDADNDVLVGGRRLTAPYTITVIGDPQTMTPALNLAGGVVESVTKDGGSVIVQEPGLVRVTALHQQPDLKYAQPAS